MHVYVRFPPCTASFVPDLQAVELLSRLGRARRSGNWDKLALASQESTLKHIDGYGLDRLNNQNWMDLL